MPDLVSIEAIREAAERIGDAARRTPVVRATSLSERAGRPVWLKLENLQETGAFKIRGATNRLALLDEEVPGVVCASAGNHGQGVALAARRLGIRAVVCTPEDAPYPKIRAIRSFGARVVQEGTDFEAALERARAVADEEGLLFVPAYDHPAIIAGQGTVGLEIMEDLPDVEVVCVSVGGGGLISGIATACRALSDDVRMVGVQAAGSAPTVASFRAGERRTIDVARTIADGIRVKNPGELTFRHIRARVQAMVEVPDEAIGDAMYGLLEEEKLVTEGAGAAPAAALREGLIPGDGPVCLVISGGNVDPDLLLHLVERGLTQTGRFVAISCRIEDRPGQLHRILEVIARHRANILEIEHHRAGFHLPLGWTEVELAFETMDPADEDRILADLREEGIEVEEIGG